MRFGVFVNPGVSRLFLSRLADVGLRPELVVTRDPTWGRAEPWGRRGLALAARAAKPLARTRAGAIFAPVSDTWLEAQRRGWTTFPAQRLSDEDAAKALGVYALDWWLVFGFSMLSPALLEVPRCGALGFHPWRLPAHRGASPVVWATLAGERAGGWTISELDAGVDTGPIVLHGDVPLAEDDDAETALHHICAVGARRFAELALELSLGTELPVVEASPFVESYERPGRTLCAPITGGLTHEELARRVRAQRAGRGAPVEHEGASLGYARSVVQAPIGAWEQVSLAGARALLGVPLACGAVLGVVVTRENPT